jgi:hypothetical protein
MLAVTIKVSAVQPVSGRLVLDQKSRRFSMLRRVTQLTIVTVVLAVLVGAFPSPSAAITGNYVKDFEHPFVGLVVFYDVNEEFLGRCSGSLLTPYVFLTAGHCTATYEDDGDLYAPVTARVYFQQGAGANYDPATELDPVTGYPESCAPGTLGVTCATSDELYDFDFDEGIHDLGLIILDQPIALSEYGQLAGAGTLDALATRRGRQDVTFTNSGYGVTDPREHPESRFSSFRERLMSEAKLVNLRNAWTRGLYVQLSNNPGGGRGGTCYGDSGGPVFLGGSASNLIVSVTSFGLSPWCTGVDFSYRVDTQAAIDWILETVENSSQPGEAGKIKIIPPQSPSVTAAPAGDDTAKHKNRGKAKGKQRKGGKGKGHHRR